MRRKGAKRGEPKEEGNPKEKISSSNSQAYACSKNRPFGGPDDAPFGILNVEKVAMARPLIFTLAVSFTK
jgi:hypothetical protein